MVILLFILLYCPLHKMSGSLIEHYFVGSSMHSTWTPPRMITTLWINIHRRHAYGSSDDEQNSSMALLFQNVSLQCTRCRYTVRRRDEGGDIGWQGYLTLCTSRPRHHSLSAGRGPTISLTTIGMSSSLYFIVCCKSLQRLSLGRYAIHARRTYTVISSYIPYICPVQLPECLFHPSIHPCMTNSVYWYEFLGERYYEALYVLAI